MRRVDTAATDAAGKMANMIFLFGFGLGGIKVSNEGSYGRIPMEINESDIAFRWERW